MRSFKSLLLILPLLFVVSCSSTPSALKCDLEDGLEGVIAGAIEGAGQCSGTAAVRASVNAWVDSAGICTNDAELTASLGTVCQTIAASLSTAAGAAATNAINAKFPQWNCNPTWLTGSLETVSSLLCTTVFGALTSPALASPRHPWQAFPWHPHR